MTRIVELLRHEVPELSADAAAAVESRIRAEYAGEQVYVRKRGDLASEILARFNGRNARELARELGCGYVTVYRILKQPGRA